MRPFRIFPLLLVGFASTAFAVDGGSPTVPQASRTVVIVSDLHFGVGHVDADGGSWDAYEDFRWTDDWKAFLHAIDASGGGSTDLVFNGDTFELWQSVLGDCTTTGPNKDLGCTEQEARKRLERVLREHAVDVKAIEAFANSGNNRVIFVPGNHDGALRFDAVRGLLESQFHASSAGRIQVLPTWFWLSDDGKVLAEHGQQIGSDLNRLSKWPDGDDTWWVEDSSHARHLRRPWGDQFVQDYYNAFERKYPVIDNVTEESVGVKYALAAEGGVGTMLGVSNFVRFMLFGTSHAQWVQTMGADGIEKWDLKATRKRAATVLPALLAEDDPLRPAIQVAAADGGVSLDSISDDELKELCELQARRAKKATPPQPAACSGTMTVAKEAFTTTHAKTMATHLALLRSMLLRDHRPTGFDVFVYSHTHTAEQISKVGNTSVLNTGAWQRLISPARLEREMKAGTITTATALTRTPEALPLCYTFVRISPGAAPELLKWAGSPGASAVLPATGPCGD